MASSSERSRRTGRTWAIIGGVVLAAGVAALLIATLTPRATPAPPPTESGEPSPATSSPTSAPAGAVVDEAVVDDGWLPEPITTEPDAYIRAALASASTFDTTLSSREEWLGYLDSWFTPDTRYPETDQVDRMKAAQLELRQGVVLPESMWESMAAQNGRVAAEVIGDVALHAVPEDASGDMRIGTADVEMTFTQQDGTGSESSYTERARVSVQVLCGEVSVPTPDTDQRPGDCKVVRYFTEPVES